MGAPHGRVSFPGRNFYAECGRMHRRQRGEEGRGSTPQAEGTDSAKALGAREGSARQVAGWFCPVTHPTEAFSRLACRLRVKRTLPEPCLAGPPRQLAARGLSW